VCTNVVLRLTLSPNGPKRASTWPTSPRTTIGRVQNYFWAYGTFGENRAPILHLDQYYLQMDRNDVPLSPRHLGVPSGVSKMIYEPMVRSVQTVHLTCAEIDTISVQTKTRFHLTHITYEYHRGRPKWFPSMVRSAQTEHLSCSLINTISKRTEMSFHLTHITLVYHWVRPKRFRFPWYI
jgi:hypothetical protein